MTEKYTISAHSERINCIFVDNEYIYSDSRDCTVKVWDKKSLGL